jgi:glucan phosphoethanolaminetransferase (alkaline phosphatase superfamily)
MMNMIKNNSFNFYIFNVLGFLIICFYIWFRFIRERLPKTIPINLYFLYLIIIIFICIIFVFILKQIIRPDISHSELFKQVTFLLRYLFHTEDSLYYENLKIEKNKKT